jgi:hypothetical protein
MAFDLFSLDVLDEDVERFKNYSEPCIIQDSRLPGIIAIVANEQIAQRFKNYICYLPEECRYILEMSFEDALKVHNLKRKMGGHIRPTERRT